MSLSDSSKGAIRLLIGDIVAGRYDMIEADGRTGRLTSTELSEAVGRYGRQLTLPPDDWYRHLDVYPLESEQGCYAVDVPLWTEEEGMSDLTLSVRVDERANEPVVTINDLHVL